MLAAFVLLPWLGNSLAYSGARMLADDWFNTPAQAHAPHLWIVPAAGLAALALALTGLAVPERARMAAWVVALVGLLLVVYVPVVALWAEWRRIDLAPGPGQWLAMLFGLGLLAQPAVGAAGRLPWARRVSSAWPRRQVPVKAVPYLFLAPGLALYLFWIIGPALYTVYLSLTDWDGVSPAQWVGAANFQRLLFDDALFRQAVANNLRWLAVFVSVPAVLGLALALVFNAARRNLSLLRAGFYAPLAFSFPVIGLLWAWLFNPRLGLINGVLAALGVSSLPGWLADPHLALWCIIAAAAWRQVGYVLLLYLAGLKTIDPSLLDAAVVDGASPARLLRHVLLPLLSPITSLVLVIAVIDSLRAFDLVQVMTRGGQGTQVLGTFMYLEAFTNYRMGYGAAIAVALFALSSVGVGAYLARVMRAEVDG